MEGDWMKSSGGRIPQRIISTGEESRRSMERALAQMRGAAYRNRPEALRKQEQRDEKRKKAEEEARRRRKKNEEVNRVRREKVSQIRKRLKEAMQDPEILMDQLVVLFLQKNVGREPKSWEYISIKAVQESDITPHAVQTYKSKFSKRPELAVMMSWNKLMEMVRDEALDRITKRDGRVTTLEELGAKMTELEEELKAKKEELRMLEEGRTGTMEMEKTVEAESEASTEEVVELSKANEPEEHQEETPVGAEPEATMETEEPEPEPEPAEATEAETSAEAAEPEMSEEPEEPVKEAEPASEPEPEVVKSPTPEKDKGRRGSLRSGGARKALTKEQIIANLNKYYRRLGKIPTSGEIKALREAEPDEGWISYNTFYKYLGVSAGWSQYLEEPEGEPEPTEPAEAEPEKLTEPEEAAVPEEPVLEAPEPDETELMSAEEVTEVKKPEIAEKRKEEPEVTEEMFESEPEAIEAKVEDFGIKLKLSLKAPGMKEPFELELDLSSR